MASLSRYVCDAEIFPLHIINKHTSLQGTEKKYHFAALKIQRAWRGYVVRKMIKKWHAAATVLQKYVRGFLVRWHLPEFYQDYLDWFITQFYNKMATKIQAAWRGYWVRKDRVPVKELLARRLAIQKANEEMQKQIKEAFENMEKVQLAKMEEKSKQWVLYIIFKLHHHLRTYTTEGIYSSHGEKKLSNIEQLFKAVPLQSYMAELKKIYYKQVNQPKTTARCFIFKTQKLKQIECQYLKQLKELESRKECVSDQSIHDKPFKLTSKVDEKSYERALFAIEKYSEKKFDSSRAVDRSRHICDKDFDLNILKKVDTSRKPPYYIDFWETNCDLHNITDC